MHSVYPVAWIPAKMMTEPDLIHWAVSIGIGVVIGVLGKADSVATVWKMLLGGLVSVGIGLIAGVVAGYSSQSLVAMLWFAAGIQGDSMGLSRFLALGYGLFVGAAILEFKRRLLKSKAAADNR